MSKRNAVRRHVRVRQVIRTRFRTRSGRFVLSRTYAEPVRTETADADLSTTSSQKVIADLFQAVGAPTEDFTLRSKYGSTRARRKKKKKRTAGLQYKLKFWKGVVGKDRERKFSAHFSDSNEFNDTDWSDEDIFKIATTLVDRSMEEVFALEQKDSNRIAEIVSWINRRFDDSAFNYEFCCAASGYHADDLRELFFLRLERKHGTRFPHYQVLRNGIIDAEHGDPDAIDWVMSDSQSPMGFVDCCKSLGFNPFKARADILLPIVDHEIVAEDTFYLDENQISWDFETIVNQSAAA